MRIVILFDWRMKYLLCSIGPKDSHPNFNWMAIQSHWPLKDEEAIEWCKRISSFHGTRGTSSRKVMETFHARRHCVYARKEEGRGE
jgi:hypothetical protein